MVYILVMSEKVSNHVWLNSYIEPLLIKAIRLCYIMSSREIYNFIVMDRMFVPTPIHLLVFGDGALGGT